jgi:NAD kinase
MARIAFYSNAFDPPTVHHRWVAEQLAKQFDRVVCVPCGPRKSRIPDSRAIHRATMCDLNFHGLANVSVELDDLEDNVYTPAIELAARFAKPGDDVWHVVASEWIRGGGAEDSTIHREWRDGTELWKKHGFVVLAERGEPLDEADLPPRHTVLTHPPHMPSGIVRLMLSQCENVEEQLEPMVAAYVARHGLFRDVPLTGPLSLLPVMPKLEIVADAMNPTSQRVAALLKDQVAADPDLIVSIGGDGTMLRAIRSLWRRRRPFFGINTGGLGFLLNGREPIEFNATPLRMYHLPLLRIECTFHDGSTVESFAFNDAWVERMSGQTAWVRILVNGEERVPRLVGDGVLVATAAGSSSYARAMGATPVPLNTDVLILAGSNVLKPVFWKPVMLPLESEIVIETVDPVRRPLTGNIDGITHEKPVVRMAVRTSRTAAVELAFTPLYDPVEKLRFVQFPDTIGE